MIIIMSVAYAWANEGKETFRAPEPIELSGILRKPIKWNPQLELQPQGVTKTFDIIGPQLHDIPEGTHIRVLGIVRSNLHTGGTPDNPSPFPSQWMVWLEVTEVEILHDPMEILKRKRTQQPGPGYPPQGVGSPDP